jgi:hypothetical protein
MLLPEKPKNLFQNLKALSKCLLESVGKSLSDIVGKENSDFLSRMFQVCHIFEHNMGVMDEYYSIQVDDFMKLWDRIFRRPTLNDAVFKVVLQYLSIMCRSICWHALQSSEKSHAMPH